MNLIDIACFAGLTTLSTAAMAQAGAPDATTPIPIPQAPVIVLPTPTPTPTAIATPAQVATPEPSPTPIAMQTPRAASASTPAARATPSPRPTPAVASTALPGVQANAAPERRPVRRVLPVPQPARSSIAPAAADVMHWQPWLYGGGVALLVVLLWLRYQRNVPSDAEEPSGEEAAPAASPPVSAVPGAWLTVSLRPVRAGLNMITAVADCEITVTNGGDAPAEAIRTALQLIAAHGGQSAEIDAANARPIVRPVFPAFALAPGESRTFRSVATAPLNALPTMGAGARDMLVPLIVLNLQHRDRTGAEHRTSQAFVIGVERVDSPKLAPFWLDSLRMSDQVAARTSGATLRREIVASSRGVGHIS